MDRGWGRITGRADPRPMRSTHYQSDKPQWHHFTPMGDPTGYLDEGKGLPWIAMCLSPQRLLVSDGGKDHRERVSSVQVSTEVTDQTSLFERHLAIP